MRTLIAIGTSFLQPPLPCSWQYKTGTVGTGQTPFVCMYVPLPYLLLFLISEEFTFLSKCLFKVL